MLSALRLVMERATNRAEPFDVLVGVLLGLVSQNPVVLTRHELIVRVGTFVPGVEPCGPSLVVGLLSSERVRLAAMAADRDLVDRRLALFVVRLGYRLMGSQLPGVQVEEDALRRTKEGMVAAGEDGNSFGPLRCTEDLNHGGEDRPITVFRQPLYANLVNDGGIGHIQQALASPHELPGRLLAEKDPAEPQERSYSVALVERRCGNAVACQDSPQVVRRGVAVRERASQLLPCFKGQCAPNLVVQGILGLVLHTRDDVQVRGVAREGLSEKVLGEHGNLRHVLVGADCRRRGVAVQLRQAAGLGLDSCLEPAQQVGDLGSESAGVDVRLVDGDVPPVGTERTTEKR